MFTLQILHASDLEGSVDAIEDAPNFAAIVDALEQDAEDQGFASILLSAGDNYIPGPLFNAGGDFSLGGVYEGFYNALFELIDTTALAGVGADTNGDGFFDNGEIEDAIQANLITFEQAYTTDVNGDGFLDYFEEIDGGQGGRLDIAIANALGFDASAVGNHEFDQGTDAFENIINYDSEEGNSLSTSRYNSNGEVPGHVNFLQEVDTPGVQFPYLSANLDFSQDFDVGALFQDNILPNTDFVSDLVSAREPLPGSEGAFPVVFETAGDVPDSNDQKIAPATTIERDGEIIGVIGATTQIVDQISSTGAIEDPTADSNDMQALAAVLQPIIDQMTLDGINKIIIVSHLQQFALEQELASLLSGVDVIIAGGSDTISADSQDTLRAGDSADVDYPVIVNGLDGNPTAIVSTDGEYSYVGRLVVTFDENGIIDPTSIDEAVSGAFATDEAGVLATTGAASLEEAIEGSEKATTVKNLADSVVDIVIATDSDIAGETEVFLNGERADVRTQETNLGNLTADANLVAVQKAGFDAVISLKNGGGIRAPIGDIDGETGDRLPPGENPLSGKLEGQVSELDIDNVLRFDNGLVIVDLTTEELKIVLEHAVAGTGPGNTPGQFPQVGGIHFSFDPNGTAQVLDDGNVVVEGTRIQNVSLVDENGVPIQALIVDGEVAENAPESLQVVTLDFLAGGGDGYPFEFFSEVVDTGIGEQKALSDFLRENHPEGGDDDFAIEDRDVGQDARIQIIGDRSDTVDAPIATQDIRVSVAAVADSGDGGGASEVVAFEGGELFVTNGENGSVDVFSAETGELLRQFDLTGIDGFDGLQSVDVKNGVLAVAISTPNVTENVSVFGPPVDVEVGQNGLVTLHDAQTGALLTDPIEVGNLPDSLKFNDDGTKLVVANEGQQNGEDGPDVDPIGSISVIDTTDPASPTVDTIDFTSLNGLEEQAREAGIRLADTASLGRGLEPEFVTISGDTAYVTLQEANAVATIDIATNTLLSLIPLGTVDHSVVGIDPSDDGVIDIRTFDNLVGLRMPDAIATVEIEGSTFFLTANEGDGRGDATDDLDDVPLPFLADEASVGDILDGEVTGVSIDGSVNTDGLEDLTISLIDGDTDGDGDIDVLHSFGSRSFTIFDAEGNVVFDSGSDFEKIIAEIAPERFNDDDGEDDEDRSDNKGPEPEAIAVGEIGDKTYAFIGLERDSGVMIYDITVPADAFFVNYIPGFNDVFGEDDGDFQGPETIAFISADESATGNAQIAVAYEITGQTVVYDLTEEQIKINEIRIDQDGTDDNEFFELSGSTNASLDGLSYVVIGDGSGGDGSVEEVIDLSGFRLGPDGFFLAAEDQDAFPNFSNIDLLTDLNFENSDNVTHLLIRDFDDSITDIDSDDDGTIDGALNLDIVDSVALVEDLEGGDAVYSETIVGPDGSFVPSHVFRSPDTTGDFQAGEFVFLQSDTPGFSNDAELPTVEATIMEIQGAGHVSALEGEVVVTTGIVTAVDFDGFYLQDPDGDGDDATSDAIFVFTDFESFSPVAVGDDISITGFVRETIPGGSGTGNLSTTTLDFIDVTINSSGNELPDAVLIGENGRTPPSDIVISSDELPVNLQEDPGTFNPEVDGIDFYESLEGMLVTIDDPVAVSATNGFNETFVVADDGEDATGGSDGGGLGPRGNLQINADADGLGDLNPERIQIQYDAFFDLVDENDVPAAINVGDELDDVTGVVSYSFGNFEVLVTEGFGVEDATDNTPEVTTVEGGEDELTVATYNVLNVTANTLGEDVGDDAEDDDDAAQIAVIAQHIVENLGSPDIIALQEIQDDSGVTDDGTLSAEDTLQAIVDAIAAIDGAPTYSFVSAVVDEDGENGGVPGGNIRNAFLYNEDRVEAVEFLTLESDVLEAEFGVSNPDAFDGTRDPLLGVFEFNGEEVTLINNHFSSRFGSDPIFGGPQPFTQGGEEEREQQALALNEVVDALLADDPEANVAVLGDLNTFEFTDELSEDLPGTGDDQVLTNLIGSLTEDDGYSFNFQGNSQALDHIFVTDSLLSELVEVDYVHVNVDFAEFASDHEPIVASFSFEPEGLVLVGDNGRDVLVGGDGDDEISGLRGRDILIGQDGEDEISGGRGRDLIEGGADNDLLSGDQGSDDIMGDEGDDDIFGGRGRDNLDGGDGADNIFGGGGADAINGGVGDQADDNLTGDGGPDTFVFEGLFGNDSILDFNDNRDEILIIGVDADDVEFMVAGDNTIVTVSGDTTAGTITIIGEDNFDDDALIF